MKFYIENCNLYLKKTDCIVVYIFYPLLMSRSAFILDFKSRNYILKILKSDGFQGQIGKTLLLYNVPNILSKCVLIVGLGKKKVNNFYNYEKLMKSCIKNLIFKKFRKIIICLSDLFYLKNKIYWIVRRFIQAIKKISQDLSFKHYKKVYDSYPKHLNIYLHVKQSLYFNAIKIAIKHVCAMMKGIKYTKNLSNMPPNKCTAFFLSKKSKKLEKKYPKYIKTIIFEEKDLKYNNMNAYLAVAKGSTHKPFMSIIKYHSKNSLNNQPIVLIGKGVTFDSGGLSLKPSKNMYDMKFDMSGAATIYGIMTSIAELKLPINVIGILAGCDNMIGRHSYCPGDIITTMSGKKIEITNTDAEGRLILSDVLTYVNIFNPLIVIDVATLTGACVSALGNLYSGLISNNMELSKELLSAGFRSRDLAWPLPLNNLYKKYLISKFADISNSGSGIADASVAGYFLSIFAEKYKWAHLDIAGTAWDLDSKLGSTGRPNFLLFEFLLFKSQFHI